MLSVIIVIHLMLVLGLIGVVLLQSPRVADWSARPRAS